MNRDSESILDIAMSARLVMEFVQGLTWDDFIEDVRTRDAVLYRIEVIGEAVKRLSFHFREEHTAIPWRMIAGMRDSLIHEYDTVGYCCICWVVPTLPDYPKRQSRRAGAWQINQSWVPALSAQAIRRTQPA